MRVKHAPRPTLPGFATNFGAAGAGESGLEHLADVPMAVPTGLARASLRMNRRSSPRRKSSGTALLVARDAAGAVTMTRVEIMDANAGGLGVRAGVAVGVGSRVALYFNGQSLPGRTGVVTRCSAGRGGYVVGLSVDEVVASALSA